MVCFSIKNCWFCSWRAAKGTRKSDDWGMKIMRASGSAGSSAAIGWISNLYICCKQLLPRQLRECIALAVAGWRLLSLVLSRTERVLRTKPTSGSFTPARPPAKVAAAVRTSSDKLPMSLVLRATLWKVTLPRGWTTQIYKYLSRFNYTQNWYNRSGEPRSVSIKV